MEICVTGGTGFVGAEVVRQLLAAGHRVRLLIRPSRSSPRTNPGSQPRLQVLPVDLEQPAAVAEAVQGAETLIHLVGIISEIGTQTFERVHRDLTRSVLDGSSAAGIRRFLHMSALGTRPGARSRYHRTKWAAEEAVRSSGLAWTIFRPSLIHGPGDAFTNLFARMSVWSPVLPAIGGGDNLMQPVALDRVAKAFVGALVTAESEHRTFDLCGPERLRFVEILRTILAAQGRRRWVIPVPWTLAFLQARILEWVFPVFFHRPPPLNRDQILMLQEDNIGDGAAADREFALRHETFAACLTRRWRKAS